MILYESKISTVTKIGNYVEKVFHKPFLFDYPNNWLRTYDDFCSFSQYPVKVHEVSKTKIVMDYVDGIPLNVYTRTNNSPKDCITITSQIMDMLNDSFEFAKNCKDFTIHNDFAGSNIIIQSDGSMVLIDPDSFTSMGVFDFYGAIRAIQYMSSHYTKSVIYNTIS